MYCRFLIVLSMLASMLHADMVQDLGSLSVNLSSLHQHLGKQPGIGQRPSPFGDLTFIVYTLSNGKKIRVEISDVKDLNRFNPVTKQFDVLHVEAIVNAANEPCLGGGGIDGTVHAEVNARLAQIIPQPPVTYTFYDICANLPVVKKTKSETIRCPTGDSKLVPGITLARFVVQAAGPVYGTLNQETLLKRAYETSLTIVSQSPAALNNIFDLNNNKKKASNRQIYNAYKILVPAGDDLKIKSIAFPAISTAIFGYPLNEATPIAIDTVYDFLMTQPTALEEVIFFLYIPYNKTGTVDMYNLYVDIVNKKLGYPVDLGKQ